MQLIHNFCSECHKRYMNKSLLKRPMGIHREEKCIFNCYECDYIYPKLIFEDLLIKDGMIKNFFTKFQI